MESLRQKQLSSLFQKEINEIFQRQIRSNFGNELITVTHVYITPDLLSARFYLSIYNTENKQAVLDKVKQLIPIIRKNLGLKIKNKVRRIPELAFFLDESLDEVFKLEKIFNEINQASKDNKPSDET